MEKTSSGNEEIKPGDLEHLKNKLKAEMEHEINSLKKELEEARKPKTGDSELNKTAENSKLVMDAKNQSLKILEKLDELNKQTLEIQNEIAQGKITEEEGQRKLTAINFERRKAERLAKKLNDALNDITLEEDMDPALSKALEKMKNNLKELIIDKRITDSDSLQALLDEGLKAMTDFEKGYNAKTHDDSPQIEGEELEKQFSILKEESKKLLNEFKSLQKQIAPLVEKSLSGEGLSIEEKKDLETLQEKFAEQKRNGDEILDGLIKIEENAQGALKEASKLIISALKRFVGRKDTKEDVLMLVKKNKNIAESLKELDKEYASILQKIDVTKEAIAKAQGAGQILDLQAQKLGITEEDIRKLTPAQTETGIDTFNIKSSKSKLEGIVEIEGSFLINIFPVTIAEFKTFVDDTGYKTYAEQAGISWVNYKTGWLTVKDKGIEKLIFQNSSLSTKKGACWFNPHGIELKLPDILEEINYPVVHVSYYDALAYADWKNMRLPTKEEWTLAAFGKDKLKYPWGNKADISKCNNKDSMNKNLSPVNRYEPNAYGVYDMVGNVWEWCESKNFDFKFILGGAWNLPLDEMGFASELKVKPDECNNTIGFRCVKDK